MPFKAKKKLYYSLTDSYNEVSGLIMELSGVMEMIKVDVEEATEKENIEKEFTIKPVYMTEKEFKNLPEFNG